MTTAELLGVRLSPSTVAGIRATAEECLECDSPARIRLFGSRTDPKQFGGDIDLLIEIDGPVPDVGELGRRFRIALQRRIGEWKIELAREGGVPLWVHDGKS